MVFAAALHWLFLRKLEGEFLESMHAWSLKKSLMRAALLGAFMIAAVLYVSHREGWMDLSEDPAGEERVQQITPVRETVASQVGEAGLRTAGPVDGRAGASPPAAIPPMVGPLRDNLRHLVDLADAGNPTAACRLVIAASRCREVLRNAEYTLEVQRSLENRPTPNEKTVIEILARSIEQGDRHATYCEGLEEEDLPEPSALIAKICLHCPPTEDYTSAHPFRRVIATHAKAEILLRIRPLRSSPVSRGLHHGLSYGGVSGARSASAGRVNNGPCSGELAWSRGCRSVATKSETLSLLHSDDA